MGVRSEAVRLSLEDAGFSSGMARAAAQTALLDAALRHLDGSSVKVDGSTRSSAKSIDALGVSSRRAEPSIDKLSGRLGLAARAIGAFGPAAIPVITASTAALAGLAAQGTSVALGAGVIVTAFQGVGDALKAVDKAHLDPTTKNIDAARVAMERLDPAARQAVRAMREWQPLLRDIRDNAAAGFFPGFVDGLDELEALAPQVERIFAKVGDAAGDVFSDAAGGLSGPKGREFLTFIEGEAAPTLRQFGEIAGNVAAAVGDLIMASAPLGRDFTGGLLNATRAFAAWADGLSATKGYHEFIDYVRDTGPQVMETVSSVATAFLEIGEAAAPLGGPVLHILEAVADTVAKIADSPVGPTIMAAVTATSALSLAGRSLERLGRVRGLATLSTDVERANKALKVARPSMSDFGRVLLYGGQSAEQLTKHMQSSSAAISLQAREVAKSKLHVRTWIGANKGMLAGTAALGAGSAAAAAGLDMQNTAMFAGIGMMAGPWGAAAGGAIGLTLDLADAFDKGAKSTEEWRAEISAAGFDADRLREVVADLREATRGSATEGDGFWGSIKDGLTDSKAEEAAPALKEAKAALDEATLSAQEFASASGVAGASFTEMANAFTRANEVLSGRASLRAFEESIDAASEAIKKNGRTLDINTAKGRANQEALDRIAGSAINAAQELKGTDRVKVLTRARRDFINTAVAMGVLRPEARRLADQLGLLDRIDAKPKVSVPGAASALATVRQLGQAIRDLDDKTVTIRQNTIRTYGVAGNVSGIGTGGATGMGILGTERALGGFHPARSYADGGMDRRNGHMPEIARGGTWRVWAEDETGGETYIPHANDHRRPQAKRYLEQTAELFGGSVEWYATGGRRGRDSDRDGVHELGKAAREAAKAMRQERKARLENLKQEREDLKSSVMDRFRSDIFAKPDNPWADGNDWRSKLTADIGQGEAFKAATAALAGKGLRGEALTGLLKDADLSTVQAFANKSQAELDDYRRLYETRARVSESAGRLAGDTAYGPQIAELQRELRGLRRDVVRSADRNADRVTNGVNSGARRGARRGKR